MIRLYSGLPGSGKTYSSLRLMRRAVSRKPVFSNIMLSDAFFVKGRRDYRDNYHFYDFNEHMLEPGGLVAFSRDYFAGRKVVEGGILLVVDEAQMFFNSRTWNGRERMDWLSFFSYHRHYGYDVLLITQSDRMLDRQLRMLIEYETVHRKVTNFNILFNVLAWLTFHRAMFVAVDYWHGARQRVGFSFFFLSRRYMGYYDTH